LVGAREQRVRHCQAECLRSLEVDHQLVLGRCLDRQVGGFFPLEDAIDVTGSGLKLAQLVWPIGDKGTVGSVITEWVDGGESMSCHKRNDRCAMVASPRTSGDDQSAVWRAREGSEGTLDLVLVADIIWAQLYSE